MWVVCITQRQMELRSIDIFCSLKLLKRTTELIILAYWDQSGKWSLTYYGKPFTALPLRVFSSASRDGWIGLDGSLRLFINKGEVIGILSCWGADLILLRISPNQQVVGGDTVYSRACGPRPGLAISSKLDRILLETKFISTFLTLQASLKRKLYNYDK